MVGNAENILVEFDYQNIIIVDPNKIVDTEGNVKERQIKHENLVYYASLECQLLPRTRLAVGSNNIQEIQNVTISTINFLAPAGEQFLKNTYYDEFTGEKNSSGEIKYNQQKSTIQSVQTEDKSTEYYIKQSTQNNYDTGLLGMRNINVTVNSAGFTEVSMELDDIRGRALFEKGEESPYAAFFNLPYPVFYLTLKGYLGQAIKYQLSLLNFNTSFNTETGNYQISLKFIAYKYNVLTSVSISHLLATPYMYNVKYNQTPNVVTPAQQGNGTKDVQQISTSKGYGKIKEVYSEYKAKKLVDENLPELTLRQLVVRLERLEKFLLESFGKQELGPVTDADNYSEDLREYEGEVYYFGNSWFNKNLDRKKVFVEKNTGNKIYTYNQVTIDNNQQLESNSTLESIIQTYNQSLKSNPTFGENGKYKVSNQEYPSNIDVNITIDDIKYNFNIANIDFRESYILQTGKQPTTDEVLSAFSSDSQTNLFNSVSKDNGQVKYSWFCFEGENRFLGKTSKINNTLSQKSEEIDLKLSDALSVQIQKDDNGLGFRPTIRNICGILMANTEAFLRLMNDTHKLAWDARDSEVKRKAVLGQTTVTNPDDVAGNPIYPWPQFFIETNNEKGEIYELTYPGDPKVINATKGYLYEIWPEIQFVEEYIKGLTQTTDTNLDPGPISSDVGEIKRISLNSLDYFPSNVIFTNKEEVKFFYEIYERVFLSPFYQRFNKKFVLDSQVSQVVSQSEKINMINALGASSPYLISKIKQYALNAAGYTAFLQSISNNGTGESWQKFIRGEFVTPYIAEEVDKNFELFFQYNNGGSKLVQPEPNNIDKFKQYLQSTKTNETDITDTFPFTIPNWFKTNLANGNSSNQKDIYNTTKVLKYNPDFKMISNFVQNNAVNVCRPITNFNYNGVNQPTINQGTVGLKNFYLQRQLKDFIPTEGFVYYNDYVGNLVDRQTTSIFNTPYFHNAISEGIFGLKTNKIAPFTAAAYLFLNSLPLATLKEKYKTFENGNTIDLDYIFATLKKFGAVHKVPYAWILKYGSIWHRYKKYTQDGVDILDNVWTNFDYSYFYDPITSNPQKQYTITANSLNQVITLEQITNVGGNDLVEMNLGFYPLLINNYNYLFKGEDLFILFNNDELNQNLTSGYTLNVCTDSIINKSQGYNPSSPNESLKITPWVVTLQDLPNNKQYIVPSFGSNINQLQVELFKNNGQVSITPYSNSAVFDGSIRGFLSCPNYGYFDNNQIDRPSPDKYIKNIFSAQSQQESISFNKQNGYVNIEEILGVFDKNIMDLFEKEFLNFCQSMNDFKSINEDFQSSSNINSSNITTIQSPTLKNFQMLMKQMMEINNIPFTNSKDYIDKISESQYNNILNTIKLFLEFDVTFKYGNPSQFNRRLFDSFSTTNVIVDGINFGPYIPNTLPGDGVTLAQSEAFYPQVWKTLKTYVGNPTIPNLEYNDTGSTITDFFIDNNIEFSSESVATLAPIIKIYATQKDLNSPYNANSLTSDINNFLQEGRNVQNEILNSLLLAVRNELPDVTEVPEGFNQSSLNGSQTKLELWETFKAFNDSWIAGADYSQTLLFEDLLFLDRGNRDIGDLIIVDPFKIKKYFSNLNISASTYSYLMTILETHHFVTMMMPAYVNYYNVIDGTDGTQAFVDSTTEFGNNLFGTYLTVDTRKSSPKMVARYAEPGSKYPTNDTSKNKNMRFKTDSFELSKASDCPLIDKLDGKTDWTKSNRVVGFNVDIGIRNQNVFKNFSVSQELGKQTTESLIALDTAVNQSSGRNSTTQNVSLYNFYKNRSYKCSVTSMGNAMIQPTMYFNLRHVPMFNGPYLIQSVKHSVSSGGFITTFEGIRQSILSLPKVKDYIQTISKEILQTLKDKKKESDRNLQKTNTTQNNISDVSKGYVSNTQQLSQSETSCQSSLNQQFIDKNYLRLTGKSVSFNGNNNFESTLSVNELIDIIKTLSVDNKIQNYVFVLCYLESYKSDSNQFTCYNENFAGVKLNRDYSKSLTNSFFNTCYSCQNQSDGTSSPYAVFTENKFFGFMDGFLKNKLANFEVTKESFVDFYFKNWIQVNGTNEAFNTYKETTEYKNLLTEVEKALTLAKNNGI